MTYLDGYNSRIRLNSIKIIMETNFSEKRKHSDSIIKNHTIWSMGAGFIPVPIADFFAVSAVQLDMIRQIARVYDLDFKESQGKAIISSLTGSSLARLGARAVKFIPGVGTVLGGMTLAVLSGASTYALGEVFKKHFETGGTFLDFDLERLKNLYNDKFEKGKTYARQWQAEARKPDQEVTTESETKSSPGYFEEEPSLDRLEQLFTLKEKGILTDEEFQALKKKWIESQT